MHGLVPSNCDLFFHTKLKKLDVIHKGFYRIDKLSIPLLLQQNLQAEWRTHKLFDGFSYESKGENIIRRSYECSLTRNTLGVEGRVGCLLQ